jgi:1-acyl-sn-glycerol-3-phosphate acyltransferase
MPAYLDIRQWFAGALLRLLGWRFVRYTSVDLPAGELDRFPKKFIALGEPHTHLLDFFLMQLFFYYYRIPRARFLIAAEYCTPLTRRWLTRLGAIPIDSSASHRTVEELARQFDEADRMILHIPPSGALAKTDCWRSGFYHIALAAQVPVIPAYLDSATRSFGYGEPIHLTGKVSRDMDLIRAFYADKRGIRPDNESLIRLASEGRSGVQGASDGLPNDRCPAGELIRCS